jgi:hypothetical protein
VAYGDKDGYSYTPDALNGIVGRLREGARALDGATSRAVDGVDAGAPLPRWVRRWLT